MSKYTPELAESIAETIANGTPIYIAAQAHGVGKQTFYDWLENNRAFRALVEQKRAQAIEERVARIKAAGKKGNWTADAWYLERQHPEEFGIKPERKDINIQVEIRDCTQDRGLVNGRPEPKQIPYIEVETIEE